MCGLQSLALSHLEGYKICFMPVENVRPVTPCVITHEYELKREPLNAVDNNAVAIVRKREGGRSRRKCIHENEFNGETVLGHVPKLMALWLTKFLKRPTNKGRAVVKGKRVNKGAGYGLEIPCEYCFTGGEFSIQWLKSKLEEQGFL